MISVEYKIVSENRLLQIDYLYRLDIAWMHYKTYPSHRGGAFSPDRVAKDEDGQKVHDLTANQQDEHQVKSLESFDAQLEEEHRKCQQ